MSRPHATRRSFDICGQEAHFWFKDVGGFIVKNGSSIVMLPEAGVDHGLLRLYVEGMMMAMILYQRGMCVLHASVIEINGAAVALTGQIGAGKSSLAAALYTRGHRILSDDNAGIDLTGMPTVIPAYPYIKLFPAIAASLGFENGSVRTLHTSQIKITGAVTNGFAQQPLPLHSIYVLGRDYESAPARLSPLQVVIELIRNSVPTRWGCTGDAQQLQQCGLIAKTVPTFTLRTFSDLESLPRIAEALETATRASSTSMTFPVSRI
jgi:HPr Serine kinase C-terminal domain